MKKIFVGLILASLILGLVAPVVFATGSSPRPNDCCVLKHDITIGEDDVPSGSVVGAPDQENPWCDINRDGAPDGIDLHYTNWGLFCLLDSVMTVTDWIFYILLLVVVVMIVIGAFMFMTAAGDPEKAGKAKTLIIYAIIGLVIALVAKFIPSIVRYIIGM